MKGGWKWKHINRGTILYKLLHKFDKLGEVRKSSLKANSKANSKGQGKKKKRSEHLSEEAESQGQEAEMEIQETRY